LIPDGPVPLDENQPADWRLVRLEPNHIVLDQVFQEVREDLAVERHPASAEGQETCAALQIDPERFTVCWNAKCPVEIGNRKEFHLLQALHTSEGRYVGFADLAEQLGGESFDDIKPVMSRLRKLLKDAGYEDLAACIKTQKGHYGLFLPRNPKVNGAQS
jgi:DNA-binding response OmpR family regulator